MSGTILDQFLASPVASVIFIMTLITSIQAFRDSQLMYKFILNPYDVVRQKEYYRIFTSGLIHGNTTHLAVNMITFYFFAFHLETAIGHWQFAVLYVGALFLSDITTVIKHKDNPSYNALGASGAVSAVLLSVVMLRPDLTLLLFFFIPMPGWLFALAYIGYSYWASKNANDNIGHEAHLWGAIAGIVLTLILKPEVVTILQNWIHGIIY